MDIIIIFFLLVLIFSIIIHEVSHGYAAEYLGDPTARLQGRLTLNPLPHIDILGSLIIPSLLILTASPMLFGWAKPVPYNPYNLRGGKWGEAFVAGAGPLINILIALVFGLLLRFLGDSLPLSMIPLFSLIVYVNIILAFFNLIPLPPLDGSKILRALLPYKGYLAYVHFEQKFAHNFLGLFLILFLLVIFLGPFLPAFFNSIFSFITGMPMVWGM
jgi:Zn-dependent protease